MKLYMVDFKGPTKIPAAIEKKCNEILAKGALKAVNVCESQGGRLYVGLYIDESAEAKSACKVVRDRMQESIQSGVNKFLEQDVKLQFCNTTVSPKSNTLTTLLFYAQP